MDHSFTTEFVIKLFWHKSPKFKLNRQTIYYWKEKKLISPSQSPTGRLFFSFTDLLQIRTIVELRDSGVSVKTIKRSLHRLREMFPDHQYPLVELPIVALGEKVVVVKDGTRLRADTGQQYLFDVSKIKMTLARELRSFGAGDKRIRRQTLEMSTNTE